MTGDLIDLLFSFRGRISRRAWWLGAAGTIVACVAGIALFNVDSFDESANAVRGAPTMAAFLWSLLCLFVLAALCAKRLRDAGRPQWLTYTFALPGAALISGWGLGYFLAPLALDGSALAFWALAALTVPALVACAISGSADGGG